MSFTFSSFFRGGLVLDAAASSTGRFEHAYRGSLAAPVVQVGVEAAATASGGLSAGGSASGRAVLVVAVGGGLSTGGASASAVSAGGDESFGYWRRGASASNTARTSTGGFDHAWRGWEGSPAVVNGSTGQAFTAVASGGLSAGGSAVLRLPPLTVDSTGGAGLGGAAAVEAAVAVQAGGGLDAGGGSLATLAAVASSGGGLAFGGSNLMVEIGYHIYMNDGHGGPIDYANPTAVVFGASWTSPALAVGSSYQFGVRSFSVSSGLEEWNLDARVILALDAEGEDVTWRPFPPIGIRATPLSGGRARVEWTAADVDPRRRPKGFHVYVHPAAAATDFTAPAAEADYLADRGGGFAVELGGLVDSTVYAVVVRAFNAHGEEGNLSAVLFRADATPPSPIALLQAATTSVST